MVWQKWLAASKLAERASKAVGLRHAGALKSRLTCLNHREELLKPVKAFGDRIKYLPLIPFSAVAKSHKIGYNNALVEMVQKSQTLLRL